MLRWFGYGAGLGLIGYAGGRYVGTRIPLPANDWLGAALLAGVAGIVLHKVA
jgi:hypothetical protein